MSSRTLSLSHDGKPLYDDVVLRQMLLLYTNLTSGCIDLVMHLGMPLLCIDNMVVTRRLYGEYRLYVDTIRVQYFVPLRWFGDGRAFPAIKGRKAPRIVFRTYMHPPQKSLAHFRDRKTRMVYVCEEESTKTFGGRDLAYDAPTTYKGLVLLEPGVTIQLRRQSTRRISEAKSTAPTRDLCIYGMPSRGVKRRLNV